MKKITAITAAVILASMLCACGDKSSDSTGTKETSAPSGNTATAEETNENKETPEPDEFGYLKPADAFDIDLTADDPSTEDVKFVYDDEGRVVSIAYLVNGKQILVSYNYESADTVTVIAFADDTVAAMFDLPLPSFDPTAGFTEHEGYYFKGYAF
ncbi:MAG: hypothetical protein IJ737_00860 [Ruminococcus sp.]|nr:hypothetical protein [Ruminococcus sp.]